MVDQIVIDDDLLAAGFIAVPRLIYRNAALTRDARFLYGALLDFAWEAERPCWPGYEKLMGYLGCGRTQVAKYLRELQTSGYLSVLRRGQGLTNVYTLHARPVVPKANVSRGSRPKSERPVVAVRDAEVELEELHRVWEETLRQLANQMTAANHRTWFDGSRLRRLDERSAEIAVPARHQVDALRDRFDTLIRKTLRQVCGRPIAVCAYTVVRPTEQAQLPQLFPQEGDST